MDVEQPPANSTDDVSEGKNGDQMDAANGRDSLTYGSNPKQVTIPVVELANKLAKAFRVAKNKLGEEVPPVANVTFMA